ncbi:hypothetical protein F0562_005965 [Nyssa sinensis]|uniref:Uncharacterized protein n=1 Tax=Nyssa sinensis TaxID=561372 RepID=A0A5J5ANI5_9ASTE|nr:hypothetical protein F0562_005965 [Nyssa sinensis]
MLDNLEVESSSSGKPDGYWVAVRCRRSSSSNSIECKQSHFVARWHIGKSALIRAAVGEAVAATGFKRVLSAHLRHLTAASQRWRKLRKTEDRVRVLQERLRKLVEAEESASTAAAIDKAPPCSDKPTK